MNAIYIVASRSRTLYIGVTSKLQRRIWEHKTKAFGGFTAKYNIDRLVYYELFASIATAIDREKQLKRWSRAKKLALIATMNPTWLDLSEGWYHPDLIPTRKPLVKQ
jgi:putative endonuclease